MKELLTAVLVSVVVAVLVPLGISAAGTYELPPLPVVGAKPATSFGPGPGPGPGPGTVSGGTAATPASPPPLPAGATVVDLLDTLKLNVSAASAPAGLLVFRADNKGAIIHELAIVKTDLASGSIPVAAGKADESKVQLAARTKNLAGKAIEDVKVTLQAGKYALICNIPAHYQSGMHAAFTVQ